MLCGSILRGKNGSPVLDPGLGTNDDSALHGLQTPIRKKILEHPEHASTCSVLGDVHMHGCYSKPVCEFQTSAVGQWLSALPNKHLRNSKDKKELPQHDHSAIHLCKAQPLVLSDSDKITLNEFPGVVQSQ
jgi:hypothetical protein